jgi:hypothetical protein
MSEQTNEELAKLLSEALANSLVTRDLPRIIYFSGDQKEDVNKWLQNYDTQAKARSWSEEIKLQKVGAYLCDLASDWYKIYIEKSENPPKNWKDFEKELRKYFLPADNDSFLRENLYREFLFLEVAPHVKLMTDEYLLSISNLPTTCFL